jgi:hypothetical protein
MGIYLIILTQEIYKSGWDLGSFMLLMMLSLLDTLECPFWWSET